MRILIVANGSRSTKELLTFSKQFGRCASGPPTLLSVNKHSIDPQARMNEEITTIAHEIYGDHRLHIKTRVGQSVEEVIREIEDHNYNLVILGDQPSRKPARFSRASTATRVAEIAPCPVIVLKGKTDRIQRILLCDSGNKKSRLLDRFTTQLTEIFPGEEEVTILHVMSQISAGPGVRGGQLRAQALQLIEEHTHEGALLEHDLQILEHSNIHPSPKVRHGLVVDEILSEARDGNYDLVVIGAYISEGWGRFLLDDQSRKILTLVDRSILVVR